MPTKTDPLAVELTVNERIADAFVRHGVYFERVKAHEVRELLRMLEAGVFGPVSEMTERSLSRFSALRVSTLQANTWFSLMRRAREKFSAGFGSAHTALADRLYEVARAEARFTINVMGREVPFDFTGKLPSRADFRRLVARTPMNGATVREHFKALGAASFDRYKRALVEGITNGEPMSRVMQRVRGRGGALDASRRWAETQTRTALDHAANQGRGGAIEENKAAARKWQWNATFDNTCPQCASLHGTTYEVGSGPSMPLHPKCACYKTPVATGQKTPKTPLVDKWLRKQDKAAQDEMLGKTRADLWRSGRVKSARRFVTKTNRLMTLPELAAKEGISI